MPSNVSESDHWQEIDGKILVVDDDENILALIKKILENHNYDIVTVTSGKDAVKLIRSVKDFDLVILDVMMPVMTGYETAQLIREEYSLFELPVLFITAKSRVSDIIIGFESGANDYLTKPFHNDELLARVKTLVKLKKMTQYNEVLTDALELKNRFYNMTIHDLKNPLGVIKGVIGLMKAEIDFNDDQFELVDLAETSTNLMLNLVEELLQAAKIESGKVTLNKQIINLSTAAQESIEKNKKNAEKKQQTIIFEPIVNVNTFINADSLRLQEIIDNLIGNAVKYSPVGERIIISLSSSINKAGNLMVKLSIKDHGPGLTNDDMKKVFGSFQKLSAQPTGGESSTGLGLSIAKQLVEMHDGRISVESSPGNGATFSVEFPAVNQNDRDIND